MTTNAANASPLDLSQFTFSAKIDYIKFSTPCKSDLPQLDGSPRWAASEHYKSLTVHDPSRTDIHELGFALSDPDLLEFEVAIDVRPRLYVSKQDFYDQIAKVMIDLFARSLEPSHAPSMRNQYRWAFRFGRGSWPFNMKLPAPTDQQLHGARWEDAQVKCYAKMMDQDTELEPDKYCARIEVRLTGIALHRLGLTTLSDLIGFKYRKMLMPYFNHVQAVEHRSVRLRRPAHSARAGIAHLRKLADRELWNKIGVGGFVKGGSRFSSRIRFIKHTRANNRFGQALTRLEREHSTEIFVRKSSFRLAQLIDLASKTPEFRPEPITT